MLTSMKNNENKVRFLYEEKLRNDNSLLAMRIYDRPPIVNLQKYEEEYIKNKAIRNKAKNFNLPNLKKLGFKLINKSAVHKMLIKTITDGSRREIEDERNTSSEFYIKTDKSSVANSMKNYYSPMSTQSKPKMKQNEMFQNNLKSLKSNSEEKNEKSKFNCTKTNYEKFLSYIK